MISPYDKGWLDSEENAIHNPHPVGSIAREEYWRGVRDQTEAKAAGTPASAQEWAS